MCRATVEPLTADMISGRAAKNVASEELSWELKNAGSKMIEMDI